MELPETQETPGIVIFVAILNLISAFFSLLAVLFAAAGLVFGSALGLIDAFARKLSEVQAQANVNYGVHFVFLLILALFLCFFIFFLAVSIGLLKGKKLAWFIQLAMSVLGLAGFPIWTVLNAVILYFFFQPRTRAFFKA